MRPSWRAHSFEWPNSCTDLTSFDSAVIKQKKKLGTSELAALRIGGANSVALGEADGTRVEIAKDVTQRFEAFPAEDVEMQALGPAAPDDEFYVKPELHQVCHRL